MNTTLRDMFCSIACFAIVAVPTRADEAEDVTVAKNALQGVWVATAMEVGGKAAPRDAFALMRFTFDGGKLVIRGNFADEREESFSYVLNAKTSPMQLDLLPAKKGGKPIIGICESKGDELRVALRHANSDEKRPAEFATNAGSQIVVVTFKREKKE